MSRADYIIQQFCLTRGVRLDDLVGSDRYQDTCYERDLLMVALNDLTRLSQTQIGSKFNRERSATSFAIIRARQRLASGEGEDAWLTTFCDKMRADFVAAIYGQGSSAPQPRKAVQA